MVERAAIDVAQRAGRRLQLMAMASNLVAMAIEPTSALKDGRESSHRRGAESWSTSSTNGNGLEPGSNGLEPTSDVLQL